MTRASRSPWLGIELRHLAALGTVAREGSFRAAADSLGYVQSAVSQQVAHLEDVVGVRLLERRRGISPVALTEAGELLMRHGDEVLARINAAQADIDVLRAGRAGELRVGATELVAAALLPDMLAAFGRRLPGVTVRVEEMPRRELAAAVEQGALEFAFADIQQLAGPFDSVVLRHDRHVLLAPARWPVARAAHPPAAHELAGMPLIRTPGGDPVVEALRGHGVEPRHVCSCRSDAAVRALVAAGAGAAIVPELSVDASDDRVVAVALDGLLGPCELGLFRHRDRRRTTVTETFLDVAITAAGDEGSRSPATSARDAAIIGS